MDDDVVPAAEHHGAVTALVLKQKILTFRKKINEYSIQYHFCRFIMPLHVLLEISLAVRDEPASWALCIVDLSPMHRLLVGLEQLTSAEPLATGAARRVREG